MRQNLKVFGLGLISALFSSCLAGCAASNKDVLTIRVLTSEDYIYIADDGVTTLNDYFEEWYLDTYGERIKVSYDTTDTNETMYNILKTGKTHYDLMCTSDYIIQKLARENEIEIIDKNEVPHYRDYASSYIDEQLNTAFEMPAGSKENETYSIGYMWGTLGLVYNPEYDDFSKEVTREKAIHDGSSWDMLWDENYKHTASIKDSMRDTFAVATVKGLEEETKSLRDRYLTGDLLGNTAKYHEELNKIFNFAAEENLDADKLKLVENALVSLKKNSFGLEVDSGKQDIVTGKIGINLAWSGDATNAMWEAEDEDVELVYALPETGSNIWLDGWVMPKFDERSDKVHEAAMRYLDYLSTPENSALNMSYVGYTSFIAGDAVIDYVFDNFDVRSDLVYKIVETKEETLYYSLYYEDESGKECEFWLSDLASNTDTRNPDLYYYNDEDEKVSLGEKYNDRYFDYANNKPDVDLKYFFEGTLDEYDIEDAMFYSDENYYYEDAIAKETSTTVGGIFFCAYPEKEALVRCCIMEDYGDNNKRILKLWEEFKSDSLPLPAVLILSIEIGLMIFGVLAYFIGKKTKLVLRKKRKENNK